jgi:hypothetical protein
MTSRRRVAITSNSYRLRPLRSARNWACVEKINVGRESSDVRGSATGDGSVEYVVGG